VTDSLRKERTEANRISFRNRASFSSHEPTRVTIQPIYACTCAASAIDLSNNGRYAKYVGDDRLTEMTSISFIRVARFTSDTRIYRLPSPGYGAVSSNRAIV